jgi:Ca-activated chloride channel family protein
MTYRNRWVWAFVCLSASAASCTHDGPQNQTITRPSTTLAEPQPMPAPPGKPALLEAPVPAEAAPATRPEAEAPAASPAPEAPRKKIERGADGARGYGRGAGALSADKAADEFAHHASRSGEITVRGLGALGRGVGGGGVMARAPVAPAEMNREAYAHIAEHGFAHVKDDPLSTFSIDVDTASYANVRRFLRDGSLPPADAVRIEELVNYFDYDYPAPRDQEPFSIYAEVGDCPWNHAHRLVHVGVQGREIAQEHVPARNLVFLVDVSGSMQDPNKLPLLKRGLALLTQNLRSEDRVALAVYAGSSGLALPSTSGRDSPRILEALEHLEAGGSTNGAEGIELAYREAQAHFVQGGINRVILATDGDFNVGVTSEGELVRLIEEKRKSGVFLTVLGFGTGNLQDSRMEQLADKGNGNYAYIDSIAEAHKVLVREAGSTLVTIAKDVKLQVEWNPAHVASYRLLGYENRALAARDFNDDKKDAGEIGAGHNVTALYEVVPVGSDEASARPNVDPLRYQTERTQNERALQGELLTVKVRYKAPDANTSQLVTRTLADQHRALDSSSDSFRFSAAVAGFGMLLRNSEHKGAANLEALRELARSAAQRDPHGDRGELLDMMQAARRLGLGS